MLYLKETRTVSFSATHFIFSVYNEHDGYIVYIHFACYCAFLSYIQIYHLKILENSLSDILESTSQFSAASDFGTD